MSTPFFLLPFCATAPPSQTPSFSICTGPTCRQSQFSKYLPRILKTLSSTAPISNPHVDLCGCLGECGNGPNIAVITPPNQPFIQRGVTDITALLSLLQNAHVPFDTLLAAKLQKLQTLKKGDVGELQTAVDALKMSRALHVMALLWLGQRYAETGDWEKALQSVNHALDLEVGFKDAWRLKATLLERTGETERARQALGVLEKMVVTRKEKDKVRKWKKRLERSAFWGWR